MTNILPSDSFGETYGWYNSSCLLQTYCHPTVWGSLWLIQFKFPATNILPSDSFGETYGWYNSSFLRQTYCHPTVLGKPMVDTVQVSCDKHTAIRQFGEAYGVTNYSRSWRMRENEAWSASVHFLLISSPKSTNCRWLCVNIVTECLALVCNSRLAASVSKIIKNNTLWQKPEGWPSCLAHQLIYICTNGVKDWWILNKTFQTGS